MFRQPRIEVPTLRQSAKGQPCHLRTPICNGDWSTTVLCHPAAHARGMKADDFAGVFGCSACHAAVDLREKVFGELLSREDRLHYWHEGMKRQLRWWWENGFLGAPK